MSTMQIKHQNSNSDIKNQIPLLENTNHINKSNTITNKNNNEMREFNKQF
jgi:hypothetical protein